MMAANIKNDFLMTYDVYWINEQQPRGINRKKHQILFTSKSLKNAHF